MGETGKIDVISEVFGALRVRAELYFRAELRGTFSVEIPKEARRIRFHLVRRGSCWLAAPGAEPILLSEGDLALVPDGAPQILSSSAGLAPLPLPQVLAVDGALTEGELRVGEGGGGVSLLCGYCRFDEAIDHPITTGLPPLLVLRFSELGAEPWVAATLRLMLLETELNGQGAAAILARLVEIVLMQAVRRIALHEGGAPQGFIAALADASLARAIMALHRNPEQAWTIGGLAKLAGMSRARFAERFARIVGVPPIGYLTDWRLMRARALLAETKLGMEEIARRCGYRTLPSFTRRFKARFDVTPGAFRRSQH